MARTIGQKYKKQIKELVKERFHQNPFLIPSAEEVCDYVKDHLPIAAFYVWEGAHSEIEMLCFDEVMNIK